MSWDYTKDNYDRQAAADPVWNLERLIGHDLGNKRLDRKLLMKHFEKLKIPEDRKAFLELILWDKPF